MSKLKIVGKKKKKSMAAMDGSKGSKSNTPHRGEFNKRPRHTARSVVVQHMIEIETVSLLDNFTIRFLLLHHL